MHNSKEKKSTKSKPKIYCLALCVRVLYLTFKKFRDAMCKIHELLKV